MFEFNIEEYITLNQFKSITSLDLEDLEKSAEFMRDNLLFRLNCIQQENESGSRLLGLQMLDALKSRILSPDDDEKYATIIGVNY